MPTPSIRRANRADSTALGHVQVISWRSAFRGIASDDYLDHQANVENQVEDWKKILTDDTQLVFVAEND